MSEEISVERYEKLRKERRYIVVPVDLTIVGAMLSGYGWTFKPGQLPEDAILINASFDSHSLSVQFAFCHESFEPVPEAMAGPTVFMEIERLVKNEQ